MIIIMAVITVLTVLIMRRRKLVLIVRVFAKRNVSHVRIEEVRSDMKENGIPANGLVVMTNVIW